MDFNIDILFLRDLIIKANDKIMQIYQKDFEIFNKQDQSPLTIADLESNKIICEGLQQINKIINQDILIISEENKNQDYSQRKNYQYCWLVDPIDGTKEFIKKNGEFTTNIGLIKDGKVIFGMVGIPAKNLIYWGGTKIPSVMYNYQTQKLTLLKPKKETNPYIIVTSRSHLNQDTLDCIQRIKNVYQNVESISSGSSIKMLMVADGTANFYPRYGPTMEWDTCAAHGVLKGCGLNLMDLEGYELLYNKENLLNPFFITS